MRAPFYVAAAALLSACGGTSDTNGNHIPPEVVDYSTLKSAPVTDASLAQASTEPLAKAIKNGIRLQLQSQQYGGPEYVDDGIAVPSTGGANSSTSSSSGSAGGSSSSGGTAPDGAEDSDNFTATNVHVQGVDEADWAKYDGKHWFIAVQPHGGYNNVRNSGIEIVATDPGSASANVVSFYAYNDNNWGALSDFYLVQENGETSHLTSIRSQYGNVPYVMPGWGMAIDMIEPAIGIAVDGGAADIAYWWPQPVNGKVRVQMLDVTDTAEPTQDFDLTIDGTVIESRKIGNTLYLLTRYDPWLDGVVFENGDETIRAANEKALTGASVDELLPHYELNGNKAPLTTDCLMQSDMKPEYGLSSMVHITAIDLAEQEILSSQCVNSSLEVITMTLDSLYLTGTVHNGDYSNPATVIHKFTLGENGPRYAASGSVSGSLGWQADPVFRLHEHEGDFRIVTSQWSNGMPEHKLFVLEQDGDLLKTVAALPNANRPAAIGKPGEDIRAVRFEGDTSYIVTFRQTDPLYKIDLSDRLDPKIAGELEITGFATYMHPIGENYLFTIGNEADELGRITHFKAELVDVSGDDPVVAERLLLGERGSYSEALDNLHALSILKVSDDEYRVAFPLNVYQSSSSQSYPQWARTGLQLLEISGVAGSNAELTDAGMIVAADPLDTGGQYWGHARGVLHDDAAFFTHGSAIWASFWDSPDTATGPILIDPVVCTAVVINGLQINVTSLGDDSINACDATVTATDGDYSEQLVPTSTTDNGNTCSFMGAAERAGVYDVTVTLDGHQSSTQTNLTVTRDLCHVAPVQSAFLLNPL